MSKQNQQTQVPDINGKRQFACFAISTQSIIVNGNKKVLLLSSPTRNQDGAWQIAGGALEAEETILAGVLRETQEELGKNLDLRPLGIVHAETYKYGKHTQNIVVIYFLLAYEGGDINPGDDMQGSQFRWWTLDEMENENIKLYIPAPDQKWILARAIELYSLWEKSPDLTMLQHVYNTVQ